MTALADFKATNRTKINTGSIDSEGTVKFSPKSDVKMSLSEEALAPLLDLLTNLYSKPYLATLREVSSNAADAHAKLRALTNGEDGNRPIEIALPSSFSPVLTVRDYGVGMDEHTLFNVYPKYGSSTKADDMEQLGAYGLGAKTPLTLSSQYTIVTIKDGIKRTVLVKMGDDRIGVMHPVSTEETDEHSGTTIKVPIPNVNQFHQESRGFFSTWKPGTVLVDGVEPKSIYNDQAISLADDRVIIIPKRDRYSDAQFIVTIAGVAYPVSLANAGLTPENRWNSDLSVYDHFAIGTYNMGFSVIHEIPIGVIDLVPAREDLRYTERTKEVLQEAFKNGVDLLPEAINQAVSKAETRTEALKQASYWKDTIKTLRKFKKVDDKTDMKWNGSAIPGDNLDEDAELLLVTYKDDRVVKNESKPNVTYLTSGKTMFYTVSNLDSSSTLARIRQFIKGRNLDLDDVMFFTFKSKPKNKWITDNSDIEFVKWDDVVEGSRTFARKQREQKRKDREAGITPVEEGPSALTYRMLTMNEDNRLEGKDVAAKDMSGTIYYLYEGANAYSLNSLYKEIVHQFGNDVQIVTIPASRKVEAFLKRLPKAVTALPATEAVVNAVRAKAEALPLNHRINLAIRCSGRSYYGETSYRVQRNIELIYRIADKVAEHKDEIEDKDLVSLSETLTDRISLDDEKIMRHSLTEATSSIAYLQQSLKDEGVDFNMIAEKLLTTLIKTYPLVSSEDIVVRDGLADAHVIPYIKLVSSQNL